MGTSGGNRSADKSTGRSPALSTYGTVSGPGAIVGPPNPPNEAEDRSRAPSHTAPRTGRRPTGGRGSHP